MIKILLKMHLVFDFDGTITVQDTMGEFAASAVAWQQKRLGRDLRGAWDEAVRAYSADLAAVTGWDSATTLEAECRFLSSLRTVEEASLERVRRSGLLTGLGRAELFRMGGSAVAEGRVKIREGFGAVTELAERRGWRTDVVSAHWSGAFVEGVLNGAGVTWEEEEEEDDEVECLVQGADYGIAILRPESALVPLLSRLGLSAPAVTDMVRTRGRIGSATDFDQVLRSGLLQTLDRYVEG
ncbi:haloacid dehalogenase-like hydrolase [Ophiocordyceps camponoti-floridani]|uniref:Haloacid dehalogenase-like hydrolase n=1 Tax=Ophiocordyceps camponoti-floridani TaxID=2030778 RepID=A0A8H4VAR7_9HYPO|nr:haloacid dehalogenase-like hydrolase [Ophiocordyceps camponoti-floridani]